MSMSDIVETLRDAASSLERRSRAEGSQHQKRIEERGTLTARIKVLEDERDEYKAERDEIEKAYMDEVKLRDQIIAARKNRTPRVITAEELQAGTAIATFADDGFPVCGVVTGCAAGEFSLLMHGDKLQTFSMDRTLMFIADAPANSVDTSTGHVKDQADSLHVTAEDIRNSDPGSTFEDRYGDDWEWNGTKVVCNEVTGNPDGVEPEIALDAHGPFTRSTAAPRGTYSKRLAVADLDAAPVGSVLELENHCPLVRDIHGVWLGEEANYEPMFIHRWSDIWDQATLTPPEKPELPEVPNPGKHPVIMVHSGKDSGLPVREEVAVWDGDDGYMGKGFHLYPEEVRSWSPVRIVVEDGA